MFGIGGQELILLMLIGLLVLGPEKLPRIASQIGNWLGQARRMTRVMKRQLEEELDFNETTIIKPPPSAREPSQQTLAHKNKDNHAEKIEGEGGSPELSPPKKQTIKENHPSEPKFPPTEDKAEKVPEDSPGKLPPESTVQTGTKKDES